MVILLSHLSDSNNQVWIKRMFWSLVLYYAVVSAILSGVLAHHKNRDAGMWVLYSLFLGIFAFFLVWALPEGSEDPVEQRGSDDQKEPIEKKEQTDEEVEEAKKRKDEEKVIVSSLIVFAVILAFVAVAYASQW